MKILISKENAGYWQKKGVLGFRFEEKGRDGVIVEQSGKHTLTFAIGEKEKPARNDSRAKRSDSGGMTQRKLILLARRVVSEAMVKKFKTIVIDFQDFKRIASNCTFLAIARKVQFSSAEISDDEQLSDCKLSELLAINFLMANFVFRDFLSKPKEGFSEVEKVILVNADGKEIKLGIERGKIIGEEVNRARHIATMPGGEMTPSLLAKHAKKVAQGLSIKCSVLDEAQMARLKMGGVLGVGKGSEEKPKFIILEYFGAAKKEKPIVLVGKGVTFDTGGINLKPSEAILGMNMDMSGGAAVIHALVAAARLKVKKNIIALVPAVENAPSGSSYRPGDVLRSMSGKTIEVQNTDAEGRIILADALTYAKRYKPSLVVDVATLTGSAVVALGERAIALFTRDEKLEQTFRHLGEESGDYVWPLPLWDEYDEEIKGTFGDVANCGRTRWGGAITAAVFLKQFVADAYPWAHLDIAPRMTALPDEFLSKGSAGASVRLLVKLLEKF